MRFPKTFRLCVLALAVGIGLPNGWAAEYVIQISVDGLGATYLQSLISGNQLPNFKRLQQEGTWTHRARTDFDETETLPNHTTMVTARGVWQGNRDISQTTGHGWENNTDPPGGVTIHSNRGDRYAAGVFDVVPAASPTAMYATKSKFSLFPSSYPGLIDVYERPTTNPSQTITTNFLAQMTDGTPFKYAFLHYYDPDSAGHGSGWGSTQYNNAVKAVDGYLGQILSAIDANPMLKDKTAIVLSADHGGQGSGHGGISSYLNYEVPFYVWAPGELGNPGMPAGVDLYSLNPASRVDPGSERLDYSAPVQPIRNGDGANLALDLLGLGAIPGSTINSAQDLSVSGAGAAAAEVIAYTAFNEIDTTLGGVTTWAAGQNQTELGFTTLVLGEPGAAKLELGINELPDWPRRFRMRGYKAVTTFETVDLSLYDDVTAGIDILIANTGYEPGDYFYALVTNGVESMDLARVWGDDLDTLAKDTFLHYSLAIPEGWLQATLEIGSFTNSSQGSEWVDFDHIFFTGTQVPEPGSLAICLSGLGAVAMLYCRNLKKR